MKPPKKVKVCGYPVSIEVLDTAFNHGTSSGDIVDLKIRLSKELKGIALADTAMHEVLHIIYLLAPLKGSDKEERTVTTLATHWTVFMAENPRFRCWWNELICDDL